MCESKKITFTEKSSYVGMFNFLQSEGIVNSKNEIDIKFYWVSYDGKNKKEITDKSVLSSYKLSFYVDRILQKYKDYSKSLKLVKQVVYCTLKSKGILKQQRKRTNVLFFLYGYFENKTKKHFFSYYNMDTLNTVFQKLAKEENKTELASYKIELNIINNAEEALKIIEKAKKDSFKVLEKTKKNGKKYADQINKIISSYLEEINEVNNVLLKKSQIEDGKASLKRIQETAKDLGLKAKEIPVYNKLQKELEDAEDLVGDLKEFDARQYNDFKKLIKF